MSADLKILIESTDPLSDEVMAALLKMEEETDYVDFKMAFHAGEEREWLEITKDVIAFANTHGGYLVFGVKNGTYEVIGVDADTVATLREPNNLMQKINRYVDPHIASFRCRAVEVGGKACVVILIPPSPGQTHLVSKDGGFRLP